MNRLLKNNNLEQINQVVLTVFTAASELLFGFAVIASLGTLFAETPHEYSGAAYSGFAIFIITLIIFVLSLFLKKEQKLEWLTIKALLDGTILVNNCLAATLVLFYIDMMNSIYTINRMAAVIIIVGFQLILYIYFAIYYFVKADTRLMVKVFIIVPYLFTFLWYGNKIYYLILD